MNIREPKIYIFFGTYLKLCVCSLCFSKKNCILGTYVRVKLHIHIHATHIRKNRKTYFGQNTYWFYLESTWKHIFEKILNINKYRIIDKNGKILQNDGNSTLSFSSKIDKVDCHFCESRQIWEISFHCWPLMNMQICVSMCVPPGLQKTSGH